MTGTPDPVTDPDREVAEVRISDEEARHLALMDGIRRRSRRTALLYAAGAALLIPWTVYLAVSLPRRQIRIALY